MPHIYNVDGYVLNPHVNQQVGVDPVGVHHNGDGSVTLTADQLWMTHVGKLAGDPLAAFEGVVDPRNWDDCVATNSFFISMQEVPPPTPPKTPPPWTKVIDETVRLHPGSPHPDVTTRLTFDYEVTRAVVQCTFNLDDPAHPHEIVIDKGWVQATKINPLVTDDLGHTEHVEFFRFRSSKRIKFADGRQPPDPILATFWGWAATKLIDCAH
jgi:hypothetical protein